MCATFVVAMPRVRRPTLQIRRNVYTPRMALLGRVSPHTPVEPRNRDLRKRFSSGECGWEDFGRSMSEMAIYRQRPFTCLTVQGFSPYTPRHATTFLTGDSPCFVARIAALCFFFSFQASHAPRKIIRAAHPRSPRKPAAPARA